MRRIAILGAGMAGFGAVHRLYSERIRSILYEKRSYYGGRGASHKYGNGFIFDEGGHVSFTNVERIQKLFAESVNHKYESHSARVNNYWKGHWIKHPAQCNLYGLPTDLVVNIIRDFIYAQNNKVGENRNYAAWLIAKYGRTFAETFPMEYGLKFHTTTADNMTTEWLGPRMYVPSLDEVLRGALSPETPEAHYVSRFRYPSLGGFVSYLNLFVKETDLRLNHDLVALDPKSRKLIFSNGIVAPYDYVISSLPLPDLIAMIPETPTDVVEASQKLAYTSAVVVNIGISRTDIIDANWTYFYDRDLSFTRMNTPYKQASCNAPAGAGSIQVEVYYSKKYRALHHLPQECFQLVMQDLKRCGLIREEDQILLSDIVVLPYANVIYDLDRAKALEIVHGYLDDIGVVYCGRYGEWGHHWTDEAFVSGERAAQRVLDSMRS